MKMRHTAIRIGKPGMILKVKRYSFISQVLSYELFYIAASHSSDTNQFLKNKTASISQSKEFSLAYLSSVEECELMDVSMYVCKWVTRSILMLCCTSSLHEKMVSIKSSEIQGNQRGKVKATRGSIHRKKGDQASIHLLWTLSLNLLPKLDGYMDLSCN